MYKIIQNEGVVIKWQFCNFVFTFLCVVTFPNNIECCAVSLLIGPIWFYRRAFPTTTPLHSAPDCGNERWRRRSIDEFRDLSV